MKFRGHETFFIRKGWLTKGMKYVKKNAAVFVSKEEKPMDVLGIGSNMVKSLRYWMQIAGITEERKSGKRVQFFTEIGELIYKYDRYIEEQGTLALLQYKLANNKDEATAWYYFFNHFKVQEFTKDDFINNIKTWLVMEDESVTVAERSLQDDFNCIVNTYLPRYKISSKYISPENNIACPLGELGLIDYVNRENKIYRKNIVAADQIPPQIAWALILSKHEGQTEISLDKLLNEDGSIGRAFNMDIVTLLMILRRIEKMGSLKIVRTAGLDVVRVLRAETAIENIEAYYKEIWEEQKVDG
ncbi:DUF4007 family protein [Selenomonas ruminis]|uniref:DUF4007 family protein n=1 Tax=Selenomonas ruminis TaxID=2593411 RepID=A0A5D6W9S5_9FIRM|nr:DUF4007 family protein [Selenomonas sp. mPRGC5]TYZ24656.1 DUF4007 family protein [Selenomonas sp. mPRGC5]